MIEFPSNDEEIELDENDHEQTVQSKESDDSIVAFYQKFSAQLQMNSATTNHLSIQKYVCQWF